MICNLTAENFCIFGRIQGKKEKPIRANHHSISLTPGSTWAYRAAIDTWLGWESGTAVLSVSKDGEHYRDFLLDRAVILQEGVWFSITALREPSAVQMAAVFLPTLERVDAARGQFSIFPKLRVTCIHTLFYQEKERGFLLPGQAYPTAELLYVDAGSIHSVTEGQDVVLNQGDMALYGPGQWRMQYADAAAAPRLVSVSFDAVGLEEAMLAGRYFRAPQQAVILLQQMMREQERLDEVSEDLLFGLLTQLLQQLRREMGENRESGQLPHNLRGENETIRKAQQYVGEHVDKKLSVPVVAQSIGVSASYLTALFHKHLQIAPAEYIRRIKLQKSKQLIREGNLNFTQISEYLQYSTVHHFSRQFKQMYGITPTEYAKTVRG